MDPEPENAQGTTATAEAPPEEASPGIVIRDADDGGYQRFDLMREAPPDEAAPEGEPSTGEPAPASTEPEQKVDSAKGEEKPPETKGDDDDLPDEEIERLVKNPKLARRIEQLANNNLGNRLPTERQRIEEQVRQEFEKQESEFRENEEIYRQLESDNNFYRRMLEKHGEAQVLAFQAKHAAERENRLGVRGDDRQAVREQVATEYREQFNAGAIQEFKGVAEATLPFWNDLPDDVRATVEGLKYDPEGNWLADGLEAIAKGVEKHIKKIERDHANALEEARTAGKNEAIAARESGRPVVVQGSEGSNRSWPEVEQAYAEGRISRDEFHRERRARGIDY